VVSALVTERPGSAELPAIGSPFSSSSTKKADKDVVRRRARPHLGFDVIGGMRYLTIRTLAESREGLSPGNGPGGTTLGVPDDHEGGSTQTPVPDGATPRGGMGE